MMAKNKKRRVISWTMMLMLLLNVFTFSPVYADSSGHDNLTNVNAKVMQGGKEITDGKLTSTKEISVEVSFGVPVEGDDPTPANPVRKGDTAVFELSNAFRLVSGSSADLSMKDEDGTVIKVGRVEFTTNSSNKMVIATVTFDGDAAVFDGTYDSVACKFTASLKYDDSGASDEGGEVQVTILDKTFTVNVPPAEKVYQVTKDGTANLAEKTVEWTVQVTGTQGSTALDLKGYQFVDNLASVGDYKEDSFKVGSVSKVPNWSDTTKELSYTFSEGDKSPQTVTFKTIIPDEEYYGTGVQSLTNTAKLMDQDVELGKADKTVTFAAIWITKEGKAGGEGSSGEYNPKDRTITWTITANQMGTSLNNVVITDLLPAGLTLNSATWQKWNGSDWVEKKGITPNEKGEYEIGTINSKIVLTVVTNVPDTEDGTFVTGVTNYQNTAKIKWDGLSGDGYGASSGYVGIGYNAIAKTGVADPKTGKVAWTVTVDTKKQSIPDLKVYDLLVYGDKSSGFDISKVTGLPIGVDTKDLTPQYNQKYAENFVNVSGPAFTVSVTSIERDGKRVADLLTITGLSNSEINKFTFDTQVLNPDIYAGNKNQQNVYNTASLFSATKNLNGATATVKYGSHMMAKELLKREAMADPAAGVNTQKTTDAKAGFDYQEKSVIFRLSVNADGLDLTNMLQADGTTKLGTATLTDTLPEGWEFMPFENGKDYLIFDGKTGAGTSVTAANTTPLSSVAVLSHEIGTTVNSSGKEVAAISFTFTKLDQPYVILVKAKLTEEAAEKYFASNKTTTATNNLSLKTENWTPGISTTRDVIVESKILDKTHELQSAGGALKWTVEYRPYDLDQPGDKLKDVLPVGLDLRTDASGKLLLDGNITVREMTLNANGTYTEGNLVPLELDKNVRYDNALRTLTFVIPDSQKAYQFTYITDITGEPGSVSNKVSLMSSNSTTENTEKSYTVTAADGEATMKKGGSILITKTDGTGAALAGAAFTLYASDGTTVIRQGTTGSDGTVKLKALPDGEYLLRETAAPAGYVKEIRSHTITVATINSKVVVSVDGKDGSNAITIKNNQEGTVGQLTISKTVAGNAADSTKAFDFTVTFEGASGMYSYIGNGVPNGTIKSGDTISLAHGQSITVTGLPKDASYAVTESDYSGSGYTTAKTGEKGVIEADNTMTAAFTNTKNHSGGGGGGNPKDPVKDNKTGDLTIRKTVDGNGADIYKKFDFTVTFSGASGSYSYTGQGVSGGKIKSGDTISLAHGQSITISGLPDGTTYNVTEADYTKDGYAVSGKGASGIIAGDAIKSASFTNHYGGNPGNPGTDPKDPTNEIGDGKVPQGGADGSGHSGMITDEIGDGRVPQGGMDGSVNGMPKTGEDQAASVGKLGILFSSIAFTALAGIDFVLRRKRSDAGIQK